MSLALPQLPAANLQPTPPKKNPIYEILPTARSIRLLTILPGKASTRIECKLETVNLDENPHYQALSYVWGVPSPPTEILCNGRILRVTPNLGAALQRLRQIRTGEQYLRLVDLLKRNTKKKSVFANGRRIWIDAICIDQADLNERSQQVSFMKDIYEGAQSVIVWLGENQEFSSLAIPLIRRIAKISEAEQQQQRMTATTFTHLSASSFSVSKYQKKDDFPRPEDSAWDAIEQFYENTWFRRIWVMQEVAVKNVMMMMGSEEVSLAEVRSCSTWMFRNGYVFSERRSTALFPLHSILRIGESGASHPLHWMLVRAAPMQATDPRDKVYALLGFYSKWREDHPLPLSDLQPDHKIMVVPDYKRRTWEVYGDVVRHLIQLPRDRTAGEGSLSILLRTENPADGDITEIVESEGDDTFPSWVPRWDRYTLFHNGLAFTPMGDTWTPWAPSSIIVRDLQIPSILSLRGFKLTTITFVERDFEIGNSPLQSKSNIFQRVLQHCQEEALQYQGDNMLKEAMVCTLTAGQKKDVDIFNPKNKTTLGYDAEALKGYMFFATANGYMGIGSEGLQLGDSVCVLLGGEVLFILRPDGDNYRLVGECYVHGLMNGEAMAILSTGETKEEWFDLH